MTLVLLRDRYRVVEAAGDQRWAAVDYHAPARRLVVVARVPQMPLDEAIARCDEERRLLSWTRRPGLDLPIDIFVEDGQVWTVTALPRGRPLFELDADLDVLARYVERLCELLQPGGLRFAGALEPADVTVSPEGQVHLGGFVLDEDLRVVYGGVSGRAPRDPLVEVGSLMVRLFAREFPGVDRRLWRLRELAARCAAGEGPASLFLLRRRIAAILRLPAPLLPGIRPRWLSSRWLLAVTMMALIGMSLLLGGLELASEGPRAFAGWIPGERHGELWTQGTVEAQGTLVSPLGRRRCVAYASRLVRTLERRVWDGAHREYHTVREQQVLLDRQAACAFVLVRGHERLTVLPGAVTVGGTREEVAPRSAAMVALRPGQHVVSVRGTEICIDAGDEIYLHGHRDGSAVRVPDGGPLLLWRGGWAAYVAGAAAPMVPLLLMMVGGLGVVMVVWLMFRRPDDWAR